MNYQVELSTGYIRDPSGWYRWREGIRLLAEMVLDEIESEQPEEHELEISSVSL